MPYHNKAEMTYQKLHNTSVSQKSSVFHVKNSQFLNQSLKNQQMVKHTDFINKIIQPERHRERGRDRERPKCR